MAGRDRLHVTVVCGYGVIGGAELWLLRLLDTPAARRMTLDLVVLQQGPLAAALERHGRVRVIPTGTRPWSLGGPALRLRRELHRSDPDVVLAVGVKAALVARVAGWLAGPPVVWAKHDHAFDRWLARPLGRAVDGLVAAVEELGAPASREDTVVVPPPAPTTPPASRDSARTHLARQGIRLGQAPVAVWVGRLVPYKGVEDAIRALALPPAADWHLVVLGVDDPSATGETERLRALAEELGIARRVQFPGAVDDAGHWLSAFDVLLSLTRPADPTGPGPEGFGTTSFEAMVAGVPVITVAGGAPERRLRGEAGIAIPPADPSALADALQVYSDERVRRAAGRAGRRLVEDHPDAGRCAELLIGELAKRGRRPGAGLDVLDAAAPLPAVTVVTTVLNDSAGTARLLADLGPQLRADDELVVVDAGSADGTAEVVRAAAARDPRVRLVVSPGAGISAGRNAGVRAATWDSIVCTDVGCEPAGGWLDALRRGLAEPSLRPHLVTGLYTVSRRTAMERAQAAGCYPDPHEARHPTLLVRLSSVVFGKSFEAELPTGRSVAFTREGWSLAGGYPEDLPVGEDVVFGRRLVSAGGRAVLTTDASVEWEQRPTLRATARMYYRYGKGGGLSGDRRLVARDALRAAAYPLGGLGLAVGGPATRATLLAGAAAYFAVPARRLLRERSAQSSRALALLPMAMVLRDFSKAAGCAVGLPRGALARRAVRRAGLTDE